MLENVFHLKENHTDAKTEIMAGITTFMTMAYILAVNPNILSASGMVKIGISVMEPVLPFWRPARSYRDAKSVYI